MNKHGEYTLHGELTPQLYNRGVLLSSLKFVKPKFGKLLRRVRQKRGMSLRELARQTGVDHTYISQIELGKVGPPVGRVSMTIARILESSELMELAEHALARELLIMEYQRWAMYDDMTPEFLDELKISEQEQADIKKHSAWLIPKLRDAKERREKASDWQPMSKQEEEEYFAKLFHRTKADNAQTRTKGRRRE
jgi:transcriptional regulator with XRE-family HTH domain